MVVASPFSRGDPANPRVVSHVFDNTSILKLIEWRWNLRRSPLRDASSDVGNLAFALDLAHPNVAVPALPVPAPPLVVPCLDPFPGLEEIDLESLIELAPLP